MYFVYILSNWNGKVIYVGMTNDLRRRTYEHKNELLDGFTKRYKIHKLVYYESYTHVKDAILREKQIKGLLRRKKDDLVASMNPEWKDLSAELFPDTFCVDE